MNIIKLIIQREYYTRVRKKSFIIMTILGPVLMACLLVVPIYIAQMSDKKKEIAIVDDSGIFKNHFKNSEMLSFVHLPMDIYSAKEMFFKTEYYAILYIPDVEVIFNSKNNELKTCRLYSDKQISLNIKVYLESIIKNEMEALKLEAYGINKKILSSTKTNVNISTIKIKKSGPDEKSFSELVTVLGIFSGILIYVFIFMYGIQVMRGVIEEKTNRIVEIIVSSVKPFQLMMGKIIGIALVGLTQFLLWIILAFGVFTIFETAFPEIFAEQKTDSTYIGKSKLLNSAEMENFSKLQQASNFDEINISQILDTINFGTMIFSFIFYFLGGYLLYSALFAAIGSAVDNEADTQQFMLPVTAPLIFSFLMAQFIINNPDGPIAFWLSIIPLTSPIIMMIRIPFGVPMTEVYLSIGLLIAGFIGTTWLAAKIYRTGILMYGKKISYKEIGKWLFYKS